MELSPKARLSWCAHLFKACTKQHHRELRAPLSQLIDKNSVILDVGSHAGQFAKLFAQLGPDGHVYAFEPGSYALSILRPAIRFNRLSVPPVPAGMMRPIMTFSFNPLKVSTRTETPAPDKTLVVS